MDVNTFAAKYSVKVRREECGDSVVVGKHGNVYEGFNCGRLGVCLLFTTVQKWNRVRRALEAAGFTIKQNGYTEGCVTFDPENNKQARLALKVAGAKTRRTPSAAQLAVLAAAREQRRRVLQAV